MMYPFKDSLGRTWEVAVNVATVQRVLRVAKLNLVTLGEDKLKGLGELLQDAVRFAEVLFLLCQPPTAAVSDEAFAEFAAGLDGDAMELAEQAFTDAWLGFFRKSEARDGLRKTLATMRQVGLAASDKVAAKAAAMLATVNLEQEAETLALLLMSSSGGVPGSSASIPGPSPSAS